MWGARRRRRPIRPGFADGKRAAFRSAAVRRYAWEDYERIEVRKLAREAGVSVYTFYNRFGGLEAFWYALAGSQFQAATRAMDRELDPKAWGDAPPGKIIRRIVEHVVTGMDCDTIGITRMCVRLAMTAPKAAESFRDYRSAITDRAIELLAPKLDAPDPKEAVRQAMRMVLAIAADTSWHHHGPLLSRERELMIDEITSLMCVSLGLPKPRKSINRFAVVDVEKAINASFETALQDELPIYKVDLKAFEKAVNSSSKPMPSLGHEYIKIRKHVGKRKWEEIKVPILNPDDAWILNTKKEIPKSDRRIKPKRERIYKTL
jgi:AcrR family transcriptional regulator